MDRAVAVAGGKGILILRHSSTGTAWHLVIRGDEEPEASWERGPVVVRAATDRGDDGKSFGRYLKPVPGFFSHLLTSDGARSILEGGGSSGG